MEEQFEELKRTVDAAVADAKDVFNIGHIMGTKDDDDARELVQSLLSQGLLGSAPDGAEGETHQ